MLGHPGATHFLHPSYGAAAAAAAGARPGGAGDFVGRADDFAASMSKFMDRSFGDSPPPPTVPTNDPTANECKIVEYRGEKVAAFVIAGKTMLCLPQVFELFLKHLVGGLHTVYTKLKRLEITPIVCNVEQVRILRGLGAIQPGVNRCKLLADMDFDALYKDCTTTRLSSRPGRPPKRGVPFPPMSPQDAMLHLKNSMHVANGSSPSSVAAAAAAAAAAAGGTGGGGVVVPGQIGTTAAGSSAGTTSGPIGSSPGSNPSSTTPSSDPYKDGPYSKEPRLDKSPFGNGFGPVPTPGSVPPGLNPMAAQFMALNHPAHAAFLSQTGAMSAHFPGLPTSSPSSQQQQQQQQQAAAAAAAAAAQFMKGPGLTSLEALQRSGLLGAAYFERMREGQKPVSTPGGGLDDQSEELHGRKRSSSQDSYPKGDENRGDSPVLNLSKPPSYPPPTLPPTTTSSQLSYAQSAGVNAASSGGGGGAPAGAAESLSESGCGGRDDDLVSEDDYDSEAKVLRRSSSRTAANAAEVKTASADDRDKVNNNSRSVAASDLKQPQPPAATAGGAPGFANLLSAAGDLPKDASQLSNVYGLIGNIQALLKAAVENSNKDKDVGKVESKTSSGLISVGKADNDDDDDDEKESNKEVEELKRNTAMYLRRFKKEKRHRRRLQEQLEQETRRRVQMEEALRVTSAETLKRITESFAKDESSNSNRQSKRRRRDTDDGSLTSGGGGGNGGGGCPDKDDLGGGGAGGDDDEDKSEDELLDRESSPASSSCTDSKQYNATVAAAETSSTPGSVGGGGGGGGGGSARDAAAPTLGIAKNLFPFNGSSLFTSAN